MSLQPCLDANSCLAPHHNPSRRCALRFVARATGAALLPQGQERGLPQTLALAAHGARRCCDGCEAAPGAKVPLERRTLMRWTGPTRGPIRPPPREP